MKNKHIFIPLFVFLGAGLVSLIWSVIDFKGVNKQLSYSSETIQFNYDGSSDGVDPNGRTFDAINFMTDDVIEAAFQKSGLTGENYSVDNVKQYIANFPLYLFHHPQEVASPYLLDVLPAKAVGHQAAGKVNQL